MMVYVSIVNHIHIYICLISYCYDVMYDIILVHIYESKNFPTYPWNIPQTPNQQFMKEFLSFGALGMPGVCSRGMLGFS